MNERCAKIAGGNSGYFCLLFRFTKRGIAIMEIHRQKIVTGDLNPHSCPCTRNSVRPPTANIAMIAESQSIGSWLLPSCSSDSTIKPAISIRRAKPPVSIKIACQLKSSIIAAATGLPHKPVRAPIVPHTPKAYALRLGGNSLRLIASPLGESIAIATP